MATADGSEENIQVIIRCRPLNARELKNKEISCISTRRAKEESSSQNEIIIRKNEQSAESFRCHGVFMGNTPQDRFFHRSNIASLLDSAIQGYRACIFAYGQTGAGKTHTIIGDSSTLDCQHENCGILGRSLLYLYGQLQLQTSDAQRRNEAGGDDKNKDRDGDRDRGEYIVRISCLELYQENLYDLLVDERNRNSLSLREHPTEGFFVEGCEMIECQTWKAAEKVINRALKARHIGSHDLNHRSNRSHFITEISLEIPDHPASGVPAHSRGQQQEEERDEEELYTVKGRMTFVDLAGSERLKNTNSAGKLLQETGSINSSLYVLGKVISGLAKSQGQSQQLGSTDLNSASDYRKEIPYRDSKLTKLLLNSLGGASRTMIISCVSESSGALSESLRTVHFSMAAARIRNRPVRYLDPQQRLILELRHEIRRLREENERLRLQGTLVGIETNAHSYRRTVDSHQQLQQPQGQQTKFSRRLLQPQSQGQGQGQGQRQPQLLQTSSQPNMTTTRTSVGRLSQPLEDSSSSLSLSRSKIQRELCVPRWDGGSGSGSGSVAEGKGEAIGEGQGMGMGLAGELFRDYLQFEQRTAQDAKAQMESPFPLNHPLSSLSSVSSLHRDRGDRERGMLLPSDSQSQGKGKGRAKERAKGKRGGAGGGGGRGGIPFIKEGSARVLSKPKRPNPYTAHLRKSSSSSKGKGKGSNSPTRRSKGQRQEGWQQQQEREAYRYPAPLSAFPDLSPLSRPAPAAPQREREARGALPEIQSKSQSERQRERPQAQLPQRQLERETEREEQSPESHSKLSSSPVSVPSSVSSSVSLAVTRAKLQQLEGQLQRQRKEIEEKDRAKDKGDKGKAATREEWLRLEALEEEAREMSLELRLSEQLSSLCSPLSLKAPAPALGMGSTGKTEDSLSYSSFLPSDSLSQSLSLTDQPQPQRELQEPPSSFSPSQQPAATEVSVYLETLHGEHISSSPPSPSPSEPQGQGQEAEGEGEEEEYGDDDFEEAEYGEEEFEEDT